MDPERLKQLKEAIRQQKLRDRPRWEYTTLTWNSSLSELDELGSDGWELVTINADSMYVFKRQLID